MKTGIETGKTLLDEMRRVEEDRIDMESQRNFLLDPLLSLTESLTLTSTGAVSDFQKWDDISTVATSRLFLNNNTSSPVTQEAIK